MTHWNSSDCSLCLRLVLTVLSAGAQQPDTKPAPRPKVALVFEGGGALGFAHIGVIEWIEAHHIPVDYVAGTSMGGLVGGLYASGMSPQRDCKLRRRYQLECGVERTTAVSGVELQA